MDYRYTAVLATISNSFSDAVLDYAVNRYNYHKVLLFTSFIAFVIQLIYGLNVGITLTYSSIPYLLIHGVFVLLGYVCFVKALEYLPLGLVGLIESSNLFLTLFIDSCVGYIKITSYFVGMFAVFIFSIFLFCKDWLSRENSCFKEIEWQGFFWVLGSVLFYVTAPYLIKASDSLGANEIAINLSYYMLGLLFLGLVVGILESLYYLLETFSFINDAPTVVMIIAQMRIFLVFLLSVLFKMDKFTFRKTFALILGVISVVGVYYS